MGKTNDLNIVIKTILNETNGESYREEAPEDAVYPYKVFSYENIDLNDINRDDLILLVDIWDKQDNYKTVDAIADTIEPLLNNLNHPTETILPTFYRVARKPIKDEDKTLKRIQLKFQIQNYERGV